MLAWRAGKGERKTNPPPSPPPSKLADFSSDTGGEGKERKKPICSKKRGGGGRRGRPTGDREGLGAQTLFLCVISGFAFHTPPVLPRIREVLYDVVFVGVRQGGTECSTWDRGL